MVVKSVDQRADDLVGSKAEKKAGCTAAQWVALTVETWVEKSDDLAAVSSVARTV